MNDHYNYLQLNVGFVAQQSIGYSREFTFDIPKLNLEPDLELIDFAGKSTFSRTSEGLLARAKLSASTSTTCVRCLADYVQSLSSEFTELFTFATHVKEDSELIFPEDGNIDLAPLVREHMFLAMPINPMCKPDCKGLCLECGNDLNTDTCDHKLVTIDPRLEILKTLLDDDE